MAYLLIIDDDIDMVHSMATVLRSEGYEVGTESEIENALEAVKVRTPDLILLDVMFPGNVAGGFDLARKLSGDRKNAMPIPILMMSAINQKFPFEFSSDNIDPEWLPVVEFMEKPVDFEVLKSKVKSILSYTVR